MLYIALFDTIRIYATKLCNIFGSIIKFSKVENITVSKQIHVIDFHNFIKSITNYFIPLKCESSSKANFIHTQNTVQYTHVCEYNLLVKKIICIEMVLC